VAAKSLEARRVLRDLDKELEAASLARGQQLMWSAQESAILGQLSTVLDRKAELLELYQEARAVKTKLRLSQEIRLLEASAARLLRDIKTDVAPAPGMRTVKARRAARARWDRSPDATG
jgi:hypothetical protein